jgi:uncharacterized protein (TIGR00730 family)
MIKSLCIYCASSSQIDQKYHDAARDLGRLCADNKIKLVYGGGARGSMGHLADAALEHGGSVRGVIPQFMVDLEWAHPAVDELIITETMHERKMKLIEGVDGVVALPGGSGTLEELIETMTLKRLGLFLQPIILLNLDGFYDPLIQQYERCIKEKFMDERHHALWSIVKNVDEILPALQNAVLWSAESRVFAAR